MSKNLNLKAENYSYELITGSPINLNGVCKIHPLTLREIGNVGYSEYQSIISLITVDKNTLSQSKDVNFDNLESYDIIVATCKDNKSFKRTIEDGLSLLTKEPVRFFTESAIFIVGTSEEIKDKSSNIRIIDKNIYTQIAKVVRFQNLIKPPEDVKEKVYASEKARMLAEKRERGRKMMADAKGISPTTIEDLISMAGVFTGNINKVMDWTIYQLHSQCEAFINREQHESKFQQLLAGADPKKVKLDKHWSEE